MENKRSRGRLAPRALFFSCAVGRARHWGRRGPGHHGGRTCRDVRRGTTRRRVARRPPVPRRSRAPPPAPPSLARSTLHATTRRRHILTRLVPDRLLPRRVSQAYRVRVLDAEKYAKTQELAETARDFCDKVARLSDTVATVVDAVDRQVRRRSSGPDRSFERVERSPSPLRETSGPNRSDAAPRVSRSDAVPTTDTIPAPRRLRLRTS